MSDRSSLQDLEWLVHSPFLLTPSDPYLAASVLDEIWMRHMIDRSRDLFAQLNQDASRLDNWLRAQPVRRLGHYFEQLFYFWLTHLPGIEDLRRQIPVRVAAHTLGELDLIYQDRFLHTQFHLELAVKFYLHREDGRGQAEDFIGPNAIDHLRLKVDHMLQHQLPLSLHPAAREAWPPLVPGTQRLSRGFVKGGLYFPLQQWLARNAKQALPIPTFCPPTAPQGWWIHRSALSPHCLSRLEAERWAIVPRMQGLAPCSWSHEDEALRSAAELCRDIGELPVSRSILFVGCERRIDRWVECTRAYLVPDGWPQAASPS